MRKISDASSIKKTSQPSSNESSDFHQPNKPLLKKRSISTNSEEKKKKDTLKLPINNRIFEDSSITQKSSKILSNRKIIDPLAINLSKKGETTTSQISPRFEISPRNPSEESQKIIIYPTLIQKTICDSKHDFDLLACKNLLLQLLQMGELPPDLLISPKTSTSSPSSGEHLIKSYFISLALALIKNEHKKYNNEISCFITKGKLSPSNQDVDKMVIEVMRLFNDKNNEITSEKIIKWLPIIQSLGYMLDKHNKHKILDMAESALKRIIAQPIESLSLHLSVLEIYVDKFKDLFLSANLEPNECLSVLYKLVIFLEPSLLSIIVTKLFTIDGVLNDICMFLAYNPPSIVHFSSTNRLVEKRLVNIIKQKETLLFLLDMYSVENSEKIITPLESLFEQLFKQKHTQTLQLLLDKKDQPLTYCITRAYLKTCNYNHESIEYTKSLLKNAIHSKRKWAINLIGLLMINRPNLLQKDKMVRELLENCYNLMPEESIEKLGLILPEKIDQFIKGEDKTLSARALLKISITQEGYGDDYMQCLDKILDDDIPFVDKLLIPLHTEYSTLTLKYKKFVLNLFEKFAKNHPLQFLSLCLDLHTKSKKPHNDLLHRTFSSDSDKKQLDLDLHAKSKKSHDNLLYRTFSSSGTENIQLNYLKIVIKTIDTLYFFKNNISIPYQLLLPYVEILSLAEHITKLHELLIRRSYYSDEIPKKYYNCFIIHINYVIEQLNDKDKRVDTMLHRSLLDYLSVITSKATMILNADPDLKAKVQKKLALLKPSEATTSTLQFFIHPVTIDKT